MKFYDIHCHLMNINEPDFVVILKQMSDNIGKETLNSIFAPDYFLDVKNKNFASKFGNLINVVSHSQSEMAALVEDDLRGMFSFLGEKPFVKDDKFVFAGQSFDKYVLTPLIMDFTSSNSLEKIYYNRRPYKNAFVYAEGMLSNIKEFYVERPDTLLEIQPFAGINPPAYSLIEVETWLETYFADYSPEKKDQDKDNPRFFGIKLYPPLGTDPLPQDEEEYEKMLLIYKFAEEKRIPITTHCDDEGYRITDAEVSQEVTSPERWAQVLERFPQLKLNFAHFGRQYQRSRFMMKQDHWRETIVSLMQKYPYVFSDVSFNGVSPDYYDDLLVKLEKATEEVRECMMSRLMFGSDFMIHLTKVNSYTEYLKIFENSKLDLNDKTVMATRNCEAFLFDKRVVE